MTITTSTSVQEAFGPTDSEKRRQDTRSAAYAPEGYPACPFCGQEANERVSEIMAEAYLAVEKLISAEPGSDEFWQLRGEVASFVGGEVDV